jgi:hypothetical protein
MTEMQLKCVHRLQQVIDQEGTKLVSKDRNMKGSLGLKLVLSNQITIILIGLLFLKIALEIMGKSTYLRVVTSQNYSDDAVKNRNSAVFWFFTTYEGGPKNNRNRPVAHACFLVTSCAAR